MSGARRGRRPPSRGWEPHPGRADHAAHAARPLHLTNRRALRQLLVVEASRLARLPPGSDLILADRSVHTLLANSYALERMTGIGFLTPSVRLLRNSPIPAWPDLVIYLDLPQDAVYERNNGKFPGGSIYVDAGFNAAIRAYFLRLADRESPRVAWLDATLDPADLARLSRALLRQAVARRHIQGAI